MEVSILIVQCLELTHGAVHLLLRFNEGYLTRAFLSHRLRPSFRCYAHFTGLHRRQTSEAETRFCERSIRMFCNVLHEHVTRRIESGTSVVHPLVHAVLLPVVV